MTTTLLADRRKLFAILLLLLAIAVGTALLPVHSASADDGDLVINGSFEEGTYTPDGSPTGWTWYSFNPSAVFTWDDSTAYLGDKSVKIHAPEPNDARWLQTIPVQPNTNYLYSGYIKTENVAHSTQAVDAGANLVLEGTWIRSAPLFGTTDWTYVSFVFNTEDRTAVTLGARLGFWSGTTTGTAWFDDLRLTPITSNSAIPNWKILAVIYDTTDFTYTDANGVARHIIAGMSESEKQRAVNSATEFVLTDIPALTSGMMQPTVEVRFASSVLTQLSPHGQGWWPSPDDTVAERDPAFDSVIVIWDPRGIDQNTGESIWIGSAAGLTPDMGTEQTYLTMIIEAAAISPPYFDEHRNVYKHEWGHSITSYFNANGTAPKPAVDNHSSDYVHCPTGEAYVWIDETLDNPIPNSIYNNESGFTHDYYSGTTAATDQPTRCLGITREAWATGGPVSIPPRLPNGDGTVLLLSAMRKGKVDGVRFRDEDILAYEMTTDTWFMFFDGSDVGVTNDVNAFALMDDGSLLLSFNRRRDIPGIGPVSRSDIVHFMPSSLGATTAGNFDIYLDGSDVHLDNEDIDAIGFTPDGRLLISTRRANMIGRDEDLLAFNATNLGPETSGSWELYFDGSDVDLKRGTEDVKGVWLNRDAEDIYLTTAGKFHVGEIHGNGADILTCQPQSLGTTTACEFDLFWDGSEAGFKKQVVDALVVTTESEVPAFDLATSIDDLAELANGSMADDPDDVLNDEVADDDAEMDFSSQIFLPIIASD